METNELIATLSREPRAGTALKKPAWFGSRLLLVLLAYGIGAQLVLGLRPDLGQQLLRPAFVVEIMLLASLTLAGAIAAIYAMYPDVRQRLWLLWVPYMVSALLAAFLLFQLFMPADVRMVLPAPEAAHRMECALCIGAVALLPAAAIFGLLRKGASVHPFKAGSLAVLAASGLGCLTLRLAEANDSLLHLAVWHYLPTLIFAALGAAAGRQVLKW